MMAKLKNRRAVFLLAAIAVVFITIVAVVIFGSAADAAPAPAAQVQQAPEKEVVVQKLEKIVEVEREVTVETLEDGVRDMGLLITQEYYFTDAVSQSKVKTLFNIPLGFTETSYVATYDGVVTAGLDFTKIRVELDSEAKTVTVRMPGAEIQNVDIDPNSFVLYSEKNGIGNPLSVSEYNGSLVELENKARTRAEERGLIEQADENAKRIVRSLIGGLLDLSQYRLIWDSV